MPLDKSVGAALALTFLFGPLGLFYTSAAAAVAMILVGASVGFLTLGFGLILVWPATMVWAAVDASRMHQNYQRWLLGQQGGQQGGQPIIVQQQQQAAPPPWYPPPPRRYPPPPPPAP